MVRYRVCKIFASMKSGHVTQGNHEKSISLYGTEIRYPDSRILPYDLYYRCYEIQISAKLERNVKQSCTSCNKKKNKSCRVYVKPITSKITMKKHR